MTQPVELGSKHQIEQLQRVHQKGGENDTEDGCCAVLAKLVLLVVAVALSVALFTFLSPIPALLCTVVLIGGSSYVIVPSGPTFAFGSGWGNRRAVVVPHPPRHTVKSLPGGGGIVGGGVRGVPAGGRVGFGSAFSSAPAYSRAPAPASRTAFGGGGFSSAPVYRAGGNVAFGGGAARR